ncbi:arsenic efflux pump protein [Halarchaeum acidiphilum MH1-52-1]|uniref:Arsenic efflux pump protein n=2 Tax=Halarchaeum acidiphilum TaxID=489138 RepID=U2YUV0_9EURY|nr:SLC13 family permease [Halarchaeum acidiphilum]GAD52795.1 arsenic efflux pump protein [Halarchaeum acidiphilum MH1-52-1]
MPLPWPVTVAVVVAAFALLFARQVRGYPTDRAVTAAAGAALLVALGVLSPDAALGSIDASTLLLLFGMMVHVECLARSGFYGRAAARLVNWAGTPRRLALGTLVLAAVCSALALNDAAALLLTPVLVRATADANVDPAPALIALVLGANVGSVATPLGNPQNAYVLARSPLTAGEFVAALLPVALVSLAVAAVAVALVAPRSGVVPPADVPDYDRAWAAGSVGFVALTFAILFLRPGLDPGAVAAGTAVAHLVALQIARREPGGDVLRDVDWTLLVLFGGMFVLVAGLRTTPVVPALEAHVAGGPSLGVAAFALSNLVSNVPAVLVLSTGVSAQQGWLVLAASATLAGNATPVASAASLIVLEGAARRGVDLRVKRLVAVGLPVSLVTSALAVALLVWA